MANEANGDNGSSRLGQTLFTAPDETWSNGLMEWTHPVGEYDPVLQLSIIPALD